MDERAPREPKSYYVNLRLGAEQYHRLRDAAERRRTGMSTVLRQALDRLLPPRREPRP